ncbi:16S rRNA processing protein RimM [bacterium]|nr:16S rRNA processing protein RimM [candidate division CSSED10-310 bacterium]
MCSIVEKENAEWLYLGVIRKAHGTEGSVFAVIDDVEWDRLNGLKEINCESPAGTMRCLAICGMHPVSGGVIVSFENVTDRAEAERLAGCRLVIPVDGLPVLPEWTFYHHQLIGLRVEMLDGRYLGILQDVIVTGANDVYCVRREDGSEELIPAIRSVIRNVDLDRGVMQVDPMEAV